MHQLAIQHILNYYIYLAGLCNNSFLRSLTGAVITVSFLRSLTGSIISMSFHLHCPITGACFTLFFQTIGVVQKLEDITSFPDNVAHQQWSFADDFPQHLFFL